MSELVCGFSRGWVGVLVVIICAKYKNSLKLELRDDDDDDDDDEAKLIIIIISRRIIKKRN